MIALHELFGLTPSVLAFCSRLVESGFSVWLPVLGGPVPSDGTLDKFRAAVRICISREIHLFHARRTSPVVTPLRALARHAADSTGAPGVGVVGMCLTGGFAVAMAADARVLAAVAAQPSLPQITPVTPWCARDLGVSPTDLNTVRQRLRAGEVEILVTRFSADGRSPGSRLEGLGHPLPPGVTADVLESGSGNPHGLRAHEHSVLTEAPRHYPRESRAGERLAVTAQRVTAFLDARLA